MNISNKYQTLIQIKINMSELLCQLCAEEYSENERIPKILKCGDTFCLPCLSGLVEFTKYCPTCYAKVTGPFSDLPTNKSLLKRPMQAPEDTRLRKEKLQQQLEEQKERVTKVQDVMSKLSQIVNSSKDKVNALKERTNNDGKEQFELEISFKSLEERLWKLDLALCCCYNPRIKANFILGSYPTKEKFLNDIVTELHKRKSIFAFKSEWYNTEVHWGRLNFKNGKLLIHSFATNTPSYPSLFVPFRDLQKCMCTENFGTFIFINEVPLVCKVQTWSSRTLDFVQLCSGEDGQSLKGLTAEKRIQPEDTEIIKVEISKPMVVENDYEFLRSLPSDITETTGEKIRIRMNDFICEIIKTSCPLLSTEEGECEVAAATCKHSEKIFSNDITEKVVKDCGIFILIDQNFNFSRH
ncbi:hypothetical protein Anas_08629 [Armadillidium nasatum]|uniref:RING-type domain-containing protein n=1 Tax=Armadillidium nasatum TaxID=96803 RepID=A0A5N5SLR2_9CRUS|nr:hypothetical protein Anas_08629 [Armadillidium nasatum]